MKQTPASALLISIETLQHFVTRELSLGYKQHITEGRSVLFLILWTISRPLGWIFATWSHILSHVRLSIGNPLLFTQNSTPFSSCTSSSLPFLTPCTRTQPGAFSSSGSGTLTRVPNWPLAAFDFDILCKESRLGKHLTRMHTVPPLHGQFIYYNFRECNGAARCTAP